MAKSKFLPLQDIDGNLLIDVCDDAIVLKEGEYCPSMYSQSGRCRSQLEKKNTLRAVSKRQELYVSDYCYNR